MVKPKKPKISLVIDTELKKQIDDYRALVKEETGLNISLNEIGASLLRKGLDEGKRRKLKTARRNKPGNVRLDPNGPILAQVRNL